MDLVVKMSWEPLQESGGPKPIGEALEQIACGLQVPRIEVLQLVFDHWEDLVGPVMATHATPMRLKDGELTVAVDDPTWAAEVKFFSADLMSRINARASQQSITSVRIKIRHRS